MSTYAVRIVFALILAMSSLVVGYAARMVMDGLEATRTTVSPSNRVCGKAEVTFARDGNDVAWLVGDLNAFYEMMDRCGCTKCQKK